MIINTNLDENFRALLVAANLFWLPVVTSHGRINFGLSIQNILTSYSYESQHYNLESINCQHQHLSIPLRCMLKTHSCLFFKEHIKCTHFNICLTNREKLHAISQDISLIQSSHTCSIVLSIYSAIHCSLFGNPYFPHTVLLSTVWHTQVSNNSGQLNCDPH